MDARRQRRQRSRDPLDRRFDQWIETGRQLVDGVSGARPGQRGASRAEGPAIPSLDGVGRWVGDKIDWLMDEEEDWREPW
ncbi:MAG: RNA helicase, partial [Prochlorococcus sp.]